MTKPDLNPKQKLFVAHYIVSLNAKQSAIKAGYSENTAEMQGSRLMSYDKVSKAVALGTAKTLEKVAFTADEVIEGFARIARQDPRKLFKDGKLIPIHELDDDTALTISGLDFVTVGEGTDAVAILSKVKHDDRTASLKALANHFGVAIPKAIVMGDPDAPLTIDATERAARVAALLAKAVAASGVK